MKNFSQYNDRQFLKEWEPYHGNFLKYWVKITLPIYLSVAILVRLLLYGFVGVLSASFFVFITLFIIMATLVTYFFNYKRHEERYRVLKDELMR
jgi:membrane protein YdbS with pleckstrin-like domain